MTTNPNDVRVSRELLPCPFCGGDASLPSGHGTQYEITCDGCGMATASVQICDLMTIEERATDEFKNYRYGEEFVERAKLDAIEQWNTRAQPADQQGEPAGWAHENGLKELQERKSGTWPFITCLSSHKSPVDGVTVALYRHAQPATAKVDERAEFEASGLKSRNSVWRDGKYQFLSRDEDGEEEYVDGLGLDNIKFEAWQARAKLNIPQ